MATAHVSCMSAAATGGTAVYRVVVHQCHDKLEGTSKVYWSCIYDNVLYLKRTEGSEHARQPESARCGATSKDETLPQLSAHASDRRLRHDS